MSDDSPTEIGEIRVWNGSAWTKLEPVSMSSGASGISVTGRMPKPIKWHPAPPPFARTEPRPGGVRVSGSGMSPTVADPDGSAVPEDDPDQTELRAALPCTICGMTLLDEPCSPKHAYWADHPEEHPLVKPLIANVLRADRVGDKECTVCGKVLGRDACIHADIRSDQVRMSRRFWVALTDELRRLRELKKAVDDYVAPDLSGESAVAAAAPARPTEAPSTDPS